MKASELTHDKPWFKHLGVRYLFVKESPEYNAVTRVACVDTGCITSMLHSDEEIEHLPRCTGWDWKEPEPTPLEKAVALLKREGLGDLAKVLVDASDNKDTAKPAPFRERTPEEEYEWHHDMLLGSRCG